MLRILIIAAVMLMTMPFIGQAHEMYTNAQDPVTHSTCCGGNDCNAIPASLVTDAEGGVIVKLTIEQAQKVNPHATVPINAFIPEARIQRSPDYEYHICIMPESRMAPSYGIYCFWGFRGA